MLESIIIWLVVGGLAGWLASLVVRGGGSGILVNIVVGIVGAVIAGLLFGAGINDAITINTFVYSVLGAIILLAVLHLINRGRLAR
ncbi:GlsB/YeaQ/YmgE family stress response membrane protein [Sphingomonas pruni]|uniref:GlsB/YeaQ/YmgE family stress response membrane protein n=1 Tax=Sphingomonas pruni TaxID=40683 RepID=UPI00083736E5|nr:GlsB/YeaQ/YmgE family stress response membrane protein [Sphingomonas pruni]